jgi:alpha-tubulin suppressor-like RCC1 family protein
VYKPHRIGIVSIFAAGLLLTLGCNEDVSAPSAQEEASPSAALATAGTPLSFRQVSAGHEHTCGVTTDDRAYCWGVARFGKLGNGTFEGPESCNVFTCYTRPVAVEGGLRFLQVSAGGFHTCGVTTDNKLYCWGRNSEGSLGRFEPSETATPLAVMTTRRFRQVSAGERHTCAITLTNLAFCWGSNQERQLGDGTDASFRMTPEPVAGGLHWIELTAGLFHTCGVTTTNRAYCWGHNFKGTLGDGSTTSHNAPVPVAGGIQFLQIDAGFEHTCAVNIGSRVYCWGGNENAQLGDGTRTNRLTPVPVADTRRFKQVSAGENHTCAIATNSKGVCWGAGIEGQLGNGTTFRRALPTPVSGGLLFGQVSAGFGFTCGVTTDSRAYCWGNNMLATLGDGTTDRRLVPVPVAGPA